MTVCVWVLIYQEHTEETSESLEEKLNNTAYSVKHRVSFSFNSTARVTPPPQPQTLMIVANETRHWVNLCVCLWPWDFETSIVSTRGGGMQLIVWWMIKFAHLFQSCNRKGCHHTGCTCARRYCTKEILCPVTQILNPNEVTVGSIFPITPLLPSPPGEKKLHSSLLLKALCSFVFQVITVPLANKGGSVRRT